MRLPLIKRISSEIKVESISQENKVESISSEIKFEHISIKRNIFKDTWHDHNYNINIYKIRTKPNVSKKQIKVEPT